MPRLRRWIFGLAAVLSLIFLLISSAPVHAAGEFNLTSSPLPIDLTTTPGKSVSTVIRVENSGSQAATIKVSLRKFLANGVNGNPELVTPKPADTYIKWVSFSTTQFTAQPGEWTNVTMTINPPVGAAFGYYFAVLFSNANTSSKASNAAQLNGAIATLVLLDVQAPGEKRSLQVVSFKANHGLYEYLPATFSVKVHNNGNVHVIPSGSIFIKKGNKIIGTLDMNPGGGNVLPDSNRIFTATWSDGFPVFAPKKVNGQTVNGKNGQPVLSLNWNFGHANKFRFGSYSAELVMAYNNGTQDVPIQGDLSFWVLPWKLLLIIIIIVGLVLFGVFSGLRGFARRAINRKSK